MICNSPEHNCNWRPFFGPTGHCHYKKLYACMLKFLSSISIIYYTKMQKKKMLHFKSSAYHACMPTQALKKKKTVAKDALMLVTTRWCQAFIVNCSRCGTNLILLIPVILETIKLCTKQEWHIQFGVFLLNILACNYISPTSLSWHHTVPLVRTGLRTSQCKNR